MKTVWLFLDSIRAGICFAFMLLSKNNTDRDKNNHSSLGWMLILPDFESFVKALFMNTFQTTFTTIFSNIFQSILVLYILFNDKYYPEKFT